MGEMPDRKLGWSEQQKVVRLIERGYRHKTVAAELGVPVGRVVKILDARARWGKEVTVDTLEEKEILNDREAAEMLGVSREKIKEMAREGELPGRKIGNGRTSPWRFSRQQLLAYVEGAAS